RKAQTRGHTDFWQRRSSRRYRGRRYRHCNLHCSSGGRSKFRGSSPTGKLCRRASGDETRNSDSFSRGVVKRHRASPGANETSLSNQQSSKLLTRAELSYLVNEWRARGDMITLANGCFDLLHVGHVRYLRAAKELGGKLVVAINSDESVARLKGNG